MSSSLLIYEVPSSYRSMHSSISNALFFRSDPKSNCFLALLSDHVGSGYGSGQVLILCIKKDRTSMGFITCVHSEMRLGEPCLQVRHDMQPHVQTQ